MPLEWPSKNIFIEKESMHAPIFPSVLLDLPAHLEWQLAYGSGFCTFFNDGNRYTDSYQTITVYAKNTTGIALLRHKLISYSQRCDK